MPEITPFAAIRFDHAPTDGDLSDKIAPPYDVLSLEAKNALLARSERNIVAIDLPHVPPKSAGPEEVYERAANLLGEWLDDGTLVREETPAIYLYHQRFKHNGQSYTRRKFIALVRLQPFSEGSILPHEQTFGGPKEDRLALMRATRCQLSPIFGLFADPPDDIGEAFEVTADDRPDVQAEQDGVTNHLWIATDREVIDAVVSTMIDKKVYIADGHHRYGTALLYRDWLTEQRGGDLPEDHPANFVMFVLAGMNDPGCLILPYHRALANVSLDSLLSAWSEGTAPAAREEADVVLFDGNSGSETPLAFTSRDTLKTLAPDECDAWHKLDYAYLHRHLIDELLKGKLGTEPDVRYVKSADDARETARRESGVALLMNATPMTHLRAVSEAGGLMPQKSTYFFPKLATGLTMNPLA